MPTLPMLSLGMALGVAALAGCSGGDGREYDHAVSELARRIAAADEHTPDEAPTLQDRWLAAKERPEGYLLRAKLYGKLQKPGKAIDELREAAARWPNNEDLQRAMHECVLQEMHLERAAEERENAIFQIREELRREIAERHLQQLINSSAYWSEKTTDEREAYLRSVLAKGTENVVREAALRTSTMAESEAEIQDMLRKWQTN